MSPQPLRFYQQDLSDGCDAEWRAGARNVLAVLPTGGGKTKVFSHKIHTFGVPAVASAHRGELVGQMSQALARENVRHRVVGPSDLQRACVAAHVEEFGRSFVDPNAMTAAASVDTLLRLSEHDPIFRQTRFWVQDEAHHVLKDNKWGKCCERFTNAIGLGVTATPVRADGQGLGRHADGLFDAMVLGPSMRDLIKLGFLTDYDIRIPPTSIDLRDVTVTASGDFSPEKLKAARRRSTITSDSVTQYLRWAAGKRAIVFDTDVDSAGETAQAFVAAGVPAEMVSGKTPEGLRRAIIARFRRGDLKVLVNVDLFGEGFDVPAVECVVMARPTESFALYAQQFGRALRILEGKGRALILDLVGNVMRHGGPPDVPREWTLDRRERRGRDGKEGVIPLRSCLNPMCIQPYPRTLPACPFCGFEPIATNRSGPEYVDGDLIDVDPSFWARLRGEIDRIDRAPNTHGVPPQAQGNVIKHHEARQVAQRDLRRVIALWAAWQQHLGRNDRESYRRFWYQYGTDVATAQTLNASDADALASRIRAELERANVRELC